MDKSKILIFFFFLINDERVTQLFLFTSRGWQKIHSRRQKALQTTTEQQASCVDMFINSLNNQCLAFKFTADEVDDIQSAVHDVIMQIVQKLKDLDDRYESHDVIRVGSFVEGTKIVEPDEFDYLIVIDELSKPGILEPLRVCEQGRGHVHLHITDETMKSRWSDCMDDDQLQGFVLNDPSCDAVGFSALITNLYMEQNKEKPIICSKPTGFVKFAGVRAFREPNTVIYLTWSSKHPKDIFQITADLSPAIRCYNVTEIVTKDDCPYKTFYERIQQHGSFLLTPGKGYRSERSKCFRISLTEVEVGLVKSLESKHKVCYRFLKYVLAYFCCKPSSPKMCYNGLSSYILKSAVLHNVAMDGCKSDPSIYGCMEEILYYLLNCLMRDKPYLPHMPSIFIDDHNLFQNLMSYQTSKLTAIEMTMHVQSLMMLLFFIQKLEKLPTADYDYQQTVDMLENIMLDQEKAYENVEKKTEQFLDPDGNWNAKEMSTNELLQIFGVPYKILSDN